MVRLGLMGEPPEGAASVGSAQTKAARMKSMAVECQPLVPSLFRHERHCREFGTCGAERAHGQIRARIQAEFLD